MIYRGHGLVRPPETCQLPAGIVSPIDPVHHLRDAGPRGLEPVGGMVGILVAERDSANDEPILAEFEMLAPEVRIRRQGGLRNRSYSDRVCSKREVGNVGAAIDRAVGTELPIRTDDGDVGRAEKPEIFQPLQLTCLSISRGNSRSCTDVLSNSCTICVPEKRRACCLSCVSRLAGSSAGGGAPARDFSPTAELPGDQPATSSERAVKGRSVSERKS